MSLVKNFQNFNFKSVSKNSDSFEERFCDDLCEDILQYLPLEDKLRLESVSKQFQRTVFRRVYEIEKAVLFESHNDGRFEGSYSMTYTPRISSEFEFLKAIESILKKCPNIQSIDLSPFHRRKYNNLKLVLQLITKYCNHLIEFNGMSVNTNDCESKEFCQKFGLKLKEIDRYKFLKDLDHFPNLETLDLKTDSVELAQILELNLQQLKRLDFGISEGKGNMVREVLKKFNKIRHLGLYLYTDIEKSVFKAFKDSPILQNLVELKLWTDGHKNSHLIIKCLKQMTKKFPNLKRFKFRNNIILENTSQFEELMSSLKAFPYLKRLDIRLGFDSGLEFDKMFSLKNFPQQLTHLSLRFDFEHTLNESHFKDLDIYLRKLQFLRYRSKVSTHKKGVRKIGYILSRLSRLETINLWFDLKVDCQPIREKIIQKCRKIRKIEICIKENASLYSYLF